MAARLTRMSRQVVWSLCGCLASLAACDRSTDSAPAAAGQAVAPPQCERLASLELPDTTVTLAELVPAGGFTGPIAAASPVQRPPDYSGLPAFCRVAATITPDRGFDRSRSRCGSRPRAGTASSSASATAGSGRLRVRICNGGAAACAAMPLLAPIRVTRAGRRTRASPSGIRRSSPTSAGARCTR